LAPGNTIIMKGTIN